MSMHLKEKENNYDINSLNYFNSIYNNKLNNIAELNLLHYILNLYKRTKNINSHCCLILNFL